MGIDYSQNSFEQVKRIRCKNKIKYPYLLIYSNKG